MKTSLKRIALLALVANLLMASQAFSDIKFSTSDEFHDAGNIIQVEIGEEFNLYVWASTHADQYINGLSLDINSSAAGTVGATEHHILNPDLGPFDRWTGVTGGILGDAPVVNDSNAVAFTDLGLNTSGIDDFVLHSIVTLEATQVGNTELTFAEGFFEVTDTDNVGSIWGTFATGNAQVSVMAIPEPSTFGILAIALFGVLAFSERRRVKKVNAV